MNAADLARLELAKRAYQAAQPNENEVQTGVRRTRLALGKPKPRRAWFSKGLVFVVLAVGSLAYAKPHALGELVEKALGRADADATRSGVGVAAVRLPPEVTTRPQGAGKARASVAPLSANAAPLHPSAPLGASAAPLKPSATTTEGETNGARGTEPNGPIASRADAAAPTSRSSATPARPLNSAPASKRLQSSRLAAAPSGATAADGASDVAAVSDWGRVGQALARGDETQALSALDELSQSDDRRTRDKADLGRAQLLIAHGDTDRACALARALTNRRAGSRIERQAQALLKSCPR